MVRIRMQRLGRRNRPFYRISAIEKRNRRNGVVLEQLGWYDPIAKDPDKQFKIDAERVKYWLSVGAQPSDTVRDLLGHNGLLNDKQKAAWEADRKAARQRVEARKAAAAKAAAAEEEAKSDDEGGDE